MKAVFALAALAALASIANATVSIETVFTIPLPVGPSQTEFATALSGNTYYTVGAGGKLFAVNLTSKSVAWSKEFDGDAISALNAFDNVVFVTTMGGSTIALNPDGTLAWVSDLVSVSSDPARNKVIGSTLYTINEVTGYYTAFDITTGNVISSKIVNSGVFVGTDEVILNMGGGFGGGPTYLEAYNMTTNTKLWTLNNVGAYLTASNDYLLVSNVSAQDSTDVLVYDHSTMTLKRTLHAMGGVVSNGFPTTVHGGKALMLLGKQTLRLALYDLVTGYETWSEFVGTNTGSGKTAVLDVGNSLVTLIGLTLSSLNTTTWQKTLSIPNVPTDSKGSLSYLGDGILMAGNLQGYTVWDIQAGQLLSRNEHSPGASGGKAKTWINGIMVSTDGAAVIGTKVVRS